MDFRLNWQRLVLILLVFLAGSSWGFESSDHLLESLAEDLSLFRKVSESFDTKARPEPSAWKHWESTLGFEFPIEYKAFYNAFPNAWVGVLPFEGPQAGRKMLYDDAKWHKIYAPRYHEKYVLDGRFPLWPCFKNGRSYFLVADYERVGIAMQISDGEVQAGRWYILQLGTGDSESYDMSFLDFMKLMLFGEVDSPLARGLAHNLKEESFHTGAIIKNRRWRTVEEDRSWLRAIDQSDREAIVLD